MPNENQTIGYLNIDISRAMSSLDTLLKVLRSLSGPVGDVSRIQNTSLKTTPDGLRATIKGFDELGRSISQVVKDGEIVSTTLKEVSALSKQMDTAKKLVSQQSAAYRELATVSSALKRAQEGTQTYKLLNDRLTALRSEITARKEQMDLLENEAAQIVKNSNLLQEEAKMRQRVSQAAAAVEDRAASKANAEAIREANKMYNQQVDLLKRINSLTLARDATPVGQTNLRADYDARIQATSARYASNEWLIQQMDEQIVQESKLANMLETRIKLENELRAAQATQRAKQADADYLNPAVLQEAQKAYERLRAAQQNYLSAMRAGDSSSKNYWQTEIDGAQETIRTIQQKVNVSQLEENAAKRLQDIYVQTDAAINLHSKNVDSLKTNLTGFDKIISEIGTHIRQVVMMHVTNTLENMWSDALDYARTYYDLLNEIRIVSGYSEDQVKVLGQQYRDIARDMKVSSTEIAEAAVEYWRQGLPADEVNDRLVQTIQYAKVSSLEFSESAELMTAATNAMGVSAQRVADVWTYLGDASASGADEVGKAMQKVAASAGEFDLSFEWLGAYIATISEVTRQSPEVVGTALNRMFSRLRNVRQTGYNEDDDTKINDIAKALNEVDIALFDSQGNWRNIADILSDVAYKWNDLTDKQQSYIATTMAGVQAQTMFNALMGDMSNVVNGTSRAFELYEGALNSAGTAAEKYGVWQESVAAAQGNMQASLEQLYSLLNADWMKSIYDWLAGFIDLITAGISAGDGMIVKITAGVAAAGALAVAISKVVKVVGELRKADNIGKGFLSLLGGSKLSLVIAGIGAIASVITLITGAVSKANEYEPIDYSSSISQMENYIGTVQPLTEELEELASKASLSADEQTRANEIMSTLSGTSRSLKGALDNGQGGFVDLTTAVSNLNGELLEAEERLRNLETAEAMQNLQHMDDTVGDTIRNAVNGAQNAEGNRLLSEMYQLFKNTYDTGIVDMGGGVQTTFGPWLKLVLNDLQEHGDYSVNVPIGFTFSEKQVEQAINSLDKMFEFGFTNNPALAWANDYWWADEYDLRLGNLEYVGDDTAAGSRAALEESLQAQVDEAVTVVENTFLGDGVPQPLIDAITQRGGSLVTTATEAFVSGAVEASDENIERFGLDSLNTMLGWGDELIEFFGDKTLSDISQLDSLLGVEDKTEEDLALIDTLMANVNERISEWNALTPETDDDIPLFSAETVEQAEEFVEVISELDTAYGTMNETMAEYLANKRAEQELEAASRNNYADQIAEMQSAFQSDGVVGLSNVWAGFGEDMQEALMEEFPDLTEDILSAMEDLVEIEDALEEGTISATEAAEQQSAVYSELSDSLAEASKAANTDTWEDMDDIISKLQGNTEDYVEAYADVTSRMEELQQVQAAVDILQQGAAASAEEQAWAYDTLTNATGLSANALGNDMTPALQWLYSNTVAASSMLNVLANSLSKATGVRFTTSNYISELQRLQTSADQTTVSLATMMAQIISLANVSVDEDGTFNVDSFKPPTINISSSSSGGGGGGGGSSSSSRSVSEEIQKMLDQMEGAKEIADHRREMAQLAQEYHESRDELQGVILYLEREKAMVEQSSATLEGYVSQLEAQMNTQKQIIASNKEGSKAYNQAMIDLEALQQQHQEYSQELMQNKIDIEELNDAIKEQQDAIRDMEIELRDLINQAIEDREDLEERMLEGTIEVENAILEILTKRYEEERDQILELADLRREALEAEMDKIDELLEERKKLAEEEDREEEIARLEEQIARISADPTRRKEELQLREQLAKLREELAWDAAEEEANAQKEAIEDQINSIDEYIEYVEQYYAELLDDPKALIEEMKEIIKGTDEEIMNWLKENSEEFAAATEATQDSMVREWQQMLDDMRGTVRTHWDEVESIIAQGETAIIEFLKGNLADYKEAGRLQAEAYVDEWMELLDKLEAAHKQVTGDITGDYDYDYIVPDTSGGGGGSGGSGGGGGGSSSYNNGSLSSDQIKAMQRFLNAHGANLTVDGKWGEKTAQASVNYWGRKFDTAMEAWAIYNMQNNKGSTSSSSNKPSSSTNFKPVAFGDGSNNNSSSSFSSGVTSGKGSGSITFNSGSSTTADDILKALMRSSTKKYAEGGVATESALAYLHAGERVLSPTQTRLFERLVESISQPMMVSMPSMPSFPALTGGGSTMFSVENINVNVAKLIDDQDYDEVVDQVYDRLEESISRRSPVGGIRMR